MIIEQIKYYGDEDSNNLISAENGAIEINLSESLSLSPVSKYGPYSKIEILSYPGAKVKINDTLYLIGQSGRFQLDFNEKVINTLTILPETVKQIKKEYELFHKDPRNGTEGRKKQDLFFIATLYKDTEN